MTIIIISQLFMKLSFFRKKILIYKNIYSSKYNQKKKFRVLKVSKYYESKNQISIHLLNFAFCILILISFFYTFQAMFDINYFSQDPRPFYKFAREIYPGQFKPSPCHRFIKMLDKQKKLLRNYSQNIDTLEQVAGIENVIECHGE